MPNGSVPQDVYYESVYNKASLTAYNETDFLQVMTLSTRVILEKYQGVNTADFKDTFSIMYTPMNTGEFDYYGKDPISILIVLIFEMLGLGASRLI